MTEDYVGLLQADGYEAYDAYVENRKGVIRIGVQLPAQPVRVAGAASPVRRFGQARLDNNLVENAIRPSYIGNKYLLLIRHPEAGQRSALVFSLIVSGQRHGKELLAYLKDLLTRLPRRTNQDDLRPLLPVNWQKAASCRDIIGHH